MTLVVKGVPPNLGVLNSSPRRGKRGYTPLIITGLGAFNGMSDPK